MKGNEVVAYTCERAERAGVRAEMTVAHARSLLRGCTVHVETHTPEEDARQLRRLAQWALRFSPIAAPDEPDGLLLDIAGCAHLYGGERNLAERVGVSLQKLGFDARLAIAPTFACAQAVSLCGNDRITMIEVNAVRDALSPLPIAALRVNDSTCASLEEIGIERISQLLDLPRTELSARFGSELIRRMDQAMGLGVREIIEPIRRCEPLEISRVFDGAVTCLEAVQTTCHDLLSLLVKRLSQQESGVCAMTYLFHRIDSVPISLSLRLSHPSRDENHLWSLLRPRLEQINIGYGVEEIHLRAERAERIGHGQVELWPDVLSGTQSPHDSSWEQLLDHLIERLGLENVLVANPVETYIPEQTYAFHSWNEEDRKLRNEEQRTYSAARPSRLLSPPEPIRVMTVTPDGPLVWLNWRGRERRVYRSIGPERITMPWWQSSAASTNLARDYYMIVDMDGDWLWVYRDGQTGSWFVHGEWT